MRFSSARLRATGFCAPVTLAEAIDAYGRRAAAEPLPAPPAARRAAPTERAAGEPALAVVGTLVPEGGEFDSGSVSLAGQRFQRRALRALGDAGLPADVVLSMRPIAAFPRARRLWLRGGRHDAGGVEVRVLPTLNVQPVKSLLAGVVAFRELLAWGRRLPPAVSKVVLSFNLSDPPGVFAWAAARLARAKYVGWVLDLHEPGGLVADSWSRRLDFAMERRLIPRLDGLVVVADRIAQDFAPGKRYLRIESGVDREAFLEPPPPRPAGAEPFTLVLAGTLASFNGVELALDAFALLPGDGWRLTIAGGGSLEPLVRRRAAGDPRIDYAGVLPFGELISLYRQSDLLLNLRPTIALRTQYYFPSKLLELIASGTPVVSTCTGHVENELAGRVFLLREETPEALAELLRQLRALDPEARRAVGRAGREYVLAEKTWRAQADRLGAYLREVASGPADRAGKPASGTP
jgi:glycosyltransferase involved in cell wall biosynthesis